MVMEHGWRLRAALPPRSRRRTLPLPHSLFLISELLQAQCRDRASQLRLLLPPAMLLIVLMTLFATVLSMFLPLIGLISAL